MMMSSLAGYAFYYFMVILITPAQTVLPWNSCSNSWNTAYCQLAYRMCSDMMNSNSSSSNSGASPTSITDQNCIRPGQVMRTPEQEYWQ